MKLASNLFALSLTAALCFAAFGSFCFVFAFTQARTANIAPLSFSSQLDGCTADSKRSSVEAPDVISRPFITKDGDQVRVIVRRNAATAVLHDLTSCLINVNAKPEIVEAESVNTREGTLHCCRVRFVIKGKRAVALMWFQSGTISATDRWTWRWLTMTDSRIRNAPAFYQAEVSTFLDQKKPASIGAVREIAARVFEELSSK